MANYETNYFSSIRTYFWLEQPYLTLFAQIFAIYLWSIKNSDSSLRRDREERESEKLGGDRELSRSEDNCIR